MKKLNFYHHLLNLPDNTLAKQMVTIQIENEWPGLAKECKDFINSLKLTDITKASIKKNQWKKEVKKAVIEKNKEELKKEIGKLEKVKEFKDEKFEQKEYFKELNLKEARAVFKHRSKMTQYVKRNFANEPQYRNDLWQCTGCKSNVDTESHILWCDAYRDLRQGKDIKNDKDLASYLLKVFDIRSKLNTNK